MKKLRFRGIALIASLLLCVTNVLASGDGKVVSILGDSYSTFEGYLTPSNNRVWYYKVPKDGRTDVDKVGQTWWHKFIKDNGYKFGVNNSYSGATICNTGYHDDDYSDGSFINRVDNLGCPDVIIILGGTNDSWAGSPIGEYKYDGWTRYDLYSFRPAMAYMLSEITDRYPNVEVYFVLNDGLKDEINSSVREICRHYGVDCIELKDIDKTNGHPTIKGMSQISDQIQSYIAKKK